MTSRFTFGRSMTFAQCYKLDEILVIEGKKRYFVTCMRELIRNSGLKTYAKTFLDKVGIKDRVEPSKFDTYLNNVSDKKSTLKTRTGLKWDEFKKAN